MFSYSISKLDKKFRKRNRETTSFCYCVLLLLPLLIATNLFAQAGTQVIVSGAGTSAVNGTYNYLTSKDGQHAYNMDNYVIGPAPATWNAWVIMLTDGPPDYLPLELYYRNENSSSSNPPRTEWETFDEESGEGVPPAPTLSGDGSLPVEPSTDVIKITMTDAMIPQSTEIMNPFPNPFNPSTKISYNLAEEVVVSLSVVDLMGRTVKTMITGQRQKPGSYSIFWNGKNQNGSVAPSGIYFIMLKAGSAVKTQKVLLVR